MSRSRYHGGDSSDACIFCRARGTEEHHIIPQRFGGPDDADNIVDLCGQCHEKLERLYDSAFYAHFGIEDEEGQRRFHRPCFRGDCDQQATMLVRNRRVGENLHCCDDHGEAIASTDVNRVLDRATGETA